MAFPVTLNFFSPYVSIYGAFNGVIAGSVCLFIAQFFSGLILGRAWCGWLCPIAGLSELTGMINKKPVKRLPLRIIRYTLFAIWFSILILGFLAGKQLPKLNLLFATERIISVDEPAKYVIYYGVVGLFFLLSVTIGKRGACHTVCWMSPFLVAGSKVGRLLHIPQLTVVAEGQSCISCKKCDAKCPMSLPVCELQQKGAIISQHCILCGECITACPKKVLGYQMH